MNFVSRKVAKEQRRKVLDFGFSNFIPQFSNAENPELVANGMIITQVSYIEELSKSLTLMTQLSVVRVMIPLTAV
jgi:hypothetical protein